MDDHTLTVGYDGDGRLVFRDMNGWEEPIINLQWVVPNNDSSHSTLKASTASGVTLDYNPPTKQPTLGVHNDRLQRMVDRQLDLMEIYGNHPRHIKFKPIGTREQLACKAAVALSVEAIEVLNELPWKDWKAKKPVDVSHLTEELADVLHFVFQIAAVFEVDADTLYRAFIAKNDENHRRCEERSKESE